MKNIYTKSYRKYAQSNQGVLARTLCDGCGKSITAELPEIIRQEQGEKDIYCNNCQNEINKYN